MRENQKWDHRRMLWKGQNNHESLRRMCRVGECEANSSLVFHFSLYSFRSVWPQSLCLSPPATSLTFLIINRLLIFQQSTEKHALTRGGEVTLNVTLAIVCEFNGGTVWEIGLEYFYWSLKRLGGYWMWLYSGKRQNWFERYKRE